MLLAPLGIAAIKGLFLIAMMEGDKPLWCTELENG